jgi:hypothetical protein
MHSSPGAAEGDNERRVKNCVNSYQTENAHEASASAHCRRQSSVSPSSETLQAVHSHLARQSSSGRFRLSRFGSVMIHNEPRTALPGQKQPSPL